LVWRVRSVDLGSSWWMARMVVGRGDMVVVVMLIVIDG
jgi:hypothetical protein